MSDIDFQNGFLLGLTLAFKKQSEGAGFEGYIFKTATDVIDIAGSTAYFTDGAQLVLDDQCDRVPSEILTLSAIPMSDTVSITLI